MSEPTRTAVSSGAGETLSDEQLWHKYKSVLSERGFPAMLHHGFLAAIREATASLQADLAEMKQENDALRHERETAPYGKLEQQLAAERKRNEAAERERDEALARERQ